MNGAPVIFPTQYGQDKVVWERREFDGLDFFVWEQGLSTGRCCRRSCQEHHKCDVVNQILGSTVHVTQKPFQDLHEQLWKEMERHSGHHQERRRSRSKQRLYSHLMAWLVGLQSPDPVEDVVFVALYTCDRHT